MRLLANMRSQGYQIDFLPSPSSELLLIHYKMRDRAHLNSSMDIIYETSNLLWRAATNLASHRAKRASFVLLTHF